MKKRRSNSGFNHVYSVVGKFLLLLLGLSSSVSGHTHETFELNLHIEDTAYIGSDPLDSTEISEKGFVSKNINSKIFIAEGATIIGLENFTQNTEIVFIESLDSRDISDEIILVKETHTVSRQPELTSESNIPQKEKVHFVQSKKSTENLLIGRNVNSSLILPSINLVKVIHQLYSINNTVTTRKDTVSNTNLIRLTSDFYSICFTLRGPPTSILFAISNV